jgi:hypothetical protein
MPAAAPACLVLNLRGGLRRAPHPAGTHASGVETCCSDKHARQVAALHHGQLAVHVGEAGGMLVPWPGKRRMGGFAEKLHREAGIGTESPQGLKIDREECISWAVMVGKLVPALVSIPTRSGMAMCVGGGMNV